MTLKPNLFPALSLMAQHETVVSFISIPRFVPHHNKSYLIGICKPPPPRCLTLEQSQGYLDVNPMHITKYRGGHLEALHFFYFLNLIFFETSVHDSYMRNLVSCACLVFNSFFKFYLFTSHLSLPILQRNRSHYLFSEKWYSQEWFIFSNDFSSPNRNLICSKCWCNYTKPNKFLFSNKIVQARWISYAARYDMIFCLPGIWKETLTLYM